MILRSANRRADVILRRRMQRPIFLFLALLLAILPACSEFAASPTNEIIGVGGSSPEAVTESFFEDFNLALSDPDLDKDETRRSWSERLASYFAPAERIDQRIALGQMLAKFDASQHQLEEGQHLVFEVSFTAVEVVERADDQARVRLIDGKLHVRRVLEHDDGNLEILREQERPLMETIGQTSGTIPVLRVNGLWFLTERSGRITLTDGSS